MRRLLIVPVGLFVLMVATFAVGSAAQLPFVLVLSILCAAPMFLVSLGFAFGKASNQYRFLVPKEAQAVIQNQRARRPAATYEVGTGDMRGN